MGLFSRRRNERDYSTSVDSPLSLDELQARVNQYEFRFRFGNRTIHVSNRTLKVMSLCFVSFVFGAYFNTLFTWLFFSNNEKKQSVSHEIHKDENQDQNKRLEELKRALFSLEEDASLSEEERLNKEELRLNKERKRMAIDSLIDNNVLTKENIEKVNKMYPDSVCGC